MNDDSLSGSPRHLVFTPRPDLGLRGLVPQWRQMFARKNLAHDLRAGAIVAAVAVPMSIAIAVASEVPPAVGLVTAIVASLVVPLCNGTPLAITGPAAALAVLVGTIVEDHGLAGAVFVAIVAGLLQLVTGALGVARVIRLVPTSVVHGFTAGIGIIIVLQQLPRVFGFPAPDEGHVLAVLLTLPELIARADLWAVTYAALACAIMLVAAARAPKVPAPLFAIAVPTLIAITVGTGDDLGTLPIGLPAPRLPTVPTHDILALLGDAVVVFVIASATTLLSSATVDRLSGGTRHDPDQELVGQGLGNIVVSLFGGIPLSGVVARSTTNVVAGARTRLSAIVHAVILLAAAYLLPDAIARIPLAAIAGLLLAVGYLMASPATARAVMTISKTDAAGYFATMIAIVVLDLVVGVQVGIIVAVLVAGLRVTRTRVALDSSPDEPVRIAFRGPLTFLASIRVERVLDSLATADLSRGLVIDLRHVRDIDASGADAVQRIVAGAQRRNAKVALLGARPSVRDALLAAHDDDSMVLPGLAASVADVHRLIPSTSARSHLAHGVQWLRRVHASDLAHLFDQFAEGQQPHTMFITCADSRVTPAMITGADPGELFVVRNLGALLPPSELEGALQSEIAAVEYAVRVLHISSIVVCAHSNCGAMGVMRGDSPAPTEGPLFAWYVAARQCVGSLADAPHRDAAAQLAVRRQLENLRSHPFLREREAAGALELHAWFYDVAKPEVYEWNAESDAFVPVVSDASQSTAGATMAGDR